MRSAGFGGGAPGARARAERLWRETVQQSHASAADSRGSNAPHLPLSPSPEGGGGTAPRMPVTPSPPPGAESAGVRWGRTRPNDSPLPGGPATRKLRALWISAFHLGLTHDRSDAALVAWLRRRTGLGDAVFTAPAGLESAVKALEAWLARAGGVDWRPHLSLGRNGRERETHRPRARVLEAQWRLLYRLGRVRIGSLAALGAYAARHADLGRAESHLALSNAQADTLIRHFGRCIRAPRGTSEQGRDAKPQATRGPRERLLNRRRAQAAGRNDPFASTSG